ncbi:MAG: hypothetical protein EHM66_04530 [Deltaproteobacteria bacterium]|nr:MAG: hypothetical protein EHM66_04530 [Deltaproteobacteria bacterium]
MDDDEQICVLMRSISMPGIISLTVDCEPSFFKAIEVEGYVRRVIVGESNQQIVGACLMAKRRMFLNGIPADVGYMSSLRIDPLIRSKTHITQGVQIFRQWHKESFGVPFYLFAVLKDNLVARNVLTSGLFGLPASKDVGTLYAAAIPLLIRRLPRLPDGLRVVRGSVVGAVKIAKFLNRTGSEKQFFPVYTADDILADDQILQGLHLDDFYIAVTGDHIVGVIACWNQLPFRRTLVTGYSGYMRWLKQLIAPLVKALHIAPIPNPGEAFRNVFAACIAIAGNDQQIFKLLLDTILHDEYNTGKTFLMVGLMEGDPLLPALRKYLHIPIRTCIYAWAWDGLDAVNQLDGRLPYLELGGL